ncbi:glycosyltransferase family 32 protein [Xylariaceae sp. FL0016]|nr:glycosyltransferase family 32 protein [Xylariaceae sp. FL0016]
MNSPTAPLSPRLASATAKLRNRIPTQLRRTVLIYLLVVIGLLLLANIDILPAITTSGDIYKRNRHSAGVSTEQNVGKFPRKLWQTWKIDPLSFAERDLTTARSWTTKNPSYRYEVLTDSNDLTYIQQQYGAEGLNRLDLIELYQSVNATIVKADLLRYLVMYAEGGIYADIDVEALRPASRFIPDRYDEKDIDMVIGVEIDQPQFQDHQVLGKKSQSFCQWTFMAKPRLPVMLKLVEGIKEWLTAVARKQNVPIDSVVLDFDDVISGTGPSAFTAALLADMNARTSATGPSPITWANTFHDLYESKLVSRVLVLDVESFAAGQGHSDSGNHNARGALVKHHYHASNWPSRHPRYSHPVFGEVERCNWDVECVRKWDDDVETFNLLPLVEQQRRIEEKERKEREDVQLLKLNMEIGTDAQQGL